MYFRASIDMEEHQMREDEGLKMMMDGGGVGWLDIKELSTLLCELDAVATQVGRHIFS